jgi:hypothetical protein
MARSAGEQRRVDRILIAGPPKEAIIAMAARGEL